MYINDILVVYKSIQKHAAFDMLCDAHGLQSDRRR